MSLTVSEIGFLWRRKFGKGVLFWDYYLSLKEGVEDVFSGGVANSDDLLEEHWVQSRFSINCSCVGFVSRVTKQCF